MAWTILETLSDEQFSEFVRMALRESPKNLELSRSLLSFLTSEIAYDWEALRVVIMAEAARRYLLSLECV